MLDSNNHVTVRIDGVDHQGKKIDWSCHGLTGNLPILELVKLETGDTVKVTRCCGVIPTVLESAIVDFDAMSGITLNLKLQCDCGITQGTARG